MNYKLTFFILLLVWSLNSCSDTNGELIEKANQFVNNNNYEKAIEIYSNVIKRAPNLQAAYFGRGLTYLKTKNYKDALYDFNKVIELQSYGGFIVSFNKNTPHANEKIRAQVPHYEVVYQRALVKYYMDSLESSFMDFQNLAENSFERKSNSILWQGAICIRIGRKDEACGYFHLAGKYAGTDHDKAESNRMINTYCREPNKNR